MTKYVIFFFFYEKDRGEFLEDGKPLSFWIKGGSCNGM